MKSDLSNLFKSQSELAKACGVSQVSVHKWMTGKTKPSARSAIALERVTNGLVTRYELRPDIFGKPPNHTQPNGSLHQEVSLQTEEVDHVGT